MGWRLFFSEGSRDMSGAPRPMLPASHAKVEQSK
jgi:hypothetical protein